MRSDLASRGATFLHRHQVQKGSTERRVSPRNWSRVVDGFSWAESVRAGVNDAVCVDLAGVLAVEGWLGRSRWLRPGRYVEWFDGRVVDLDLGELQAYGMWAAFVWGLSGPAAIVVWQPARQCRTMRRRIHANARAMVSSIAATMPYAAGCAAKIDGAAMWSPDRCCSTRF